MFRDRYEPGEVVGRGATGRVFLAVDKKLNIKRAVKEIRLDGAAGNNALSLAGAKAELGFLKSLRHDAIPQILDIYEEGGALLIVMEYVEGENLEEAMRARGAFTVRQVLDIGLGICEVLAYLHSLDPPVAYRDLKPSNVILAPGGKVRLVDLGGCARCGEKHSGPVVGSRNYAAPEQLQGEFSPASDVYALGRTMEVLLGGRDAGELLRAVLGRCMREDPGERFSDGGQAYSALKFLRFLTSYGRYAAVLAGVLVLIAALAVFFGRGGAGSVQTAEESGGGGAVSVQTAEESGIGGAGSVQQMEESGRDGAGNVQQMEESGRDGEGDIPMEKETDAAGSEALGDGPDMAEIGRTLGEISGRLEEGSASVTGLLEEKLVLERLKAEIDELMEVCRRDDEYLGEGENEADYDLGGAMEELREYQIADLSMLSTICKLLGQRDEEARKGYYGKAAGYIEELFEIKGVKERPVYRMKLSDLVYIKQELGEGREALKYLEEWEDEHPDSGKELYFAHACMLLKSPGNETALKTLYGKMRKVREVREDFRYDEIQRQIGLYLGEKSQKDT